MDGLVEAIAVEYPRPREEDATTDDAQLPDGAARRTAARAQSPPTTEPVQTGPVQKGPVQKGPAHAPPRRKKDTRKGSEWLKPRKKKKKKQQAPPPQQEEEPIAAKELAWALKSLADSASEPDEPDEPDELAAAAAAASLAQPAAASGTSASPSPRKKKPEDEEPASVPAAASAAAAAAPRAQPAAASSTSASPSPSKKQKVDRRSRAEKACGQSNRRRRKTPRRPAGGKFQQTKMGDSTFGRADARSIQRCSPSDELEFGSPLLPIGTVNGIVTIDKPEVPINPLRCGPAYDNMRRLHQHATAPTDAADAQQVGGAVVAIRYGPTGPPPTEAAVSQELLAAAPSGKVPGDMLGTTKEEWCKRWRAARAAPSPASSRRVACAASDASLWQNEDHRFFIMHVELNRLGRRGGLPTHGPHDKDVAAAGKCSCGCKAQQMRLKRERVNLARMIDTKVHQQEHCGEICSSSHGRVPLRTRKSSPPEFALPPCDGSGATGGGHTIPAFLPRGNASSGTGSGTGSDRNKATGRKRRRSMTTEDTHESTDDAATQQQCPVSGDTDSPREDVPTADEGGAPGDEDEGQLFVGKILKHPYRKYRCKENDSVVTVCRKLKISEVKEVFELNRRRLADVEHFRQSTKLRKGHVLLVKSSDEVLETTVTEFGGWIQQEPKAGEEEWRECWRGKDQDGQVYDLEAVDIYTGLGYDVQGDTPGHKLIGQRVHFDETDAKVVAYMPETKEGENAGQALWKVHYETEEGPTGQRQDLDQAELEQALRASGASGSSILPLQPPPSKRNSQAVVTERPKEDSEKEQEQEQEQHMEQEQDGTAAESSKNDAADEVENEATREEASPNATAVDDDLEGKDEGGQGEDEEGQDERECRDEETTVAIDTASDPSLQEDNQRQGESERAAGVSLPPDVASEVTGASREEQAVQEQETQQEEEQEEEVVVSLSPSSIPGNDYDDYDYDTQGFDSQGDESMMDELATQAFDGPTQHEEGEDDAAAAAAAQDLNSEGATTPDQVDLTQHNESSADDDDDGDGVSEDDDGEEEEEEQERRTYSQRVRVKPETFDPFLETVRPQWSPAKKKLKHRRPDSSADGASADTEGLSTQSSTGSDNMDESDQKRQQQAAAAAAASRAGPPEHVMLELFCGTCTVSQRAQQYWGSDRMKRVTLDSNPKVSPMADGLSDRHIQADVMSFNVDKWCKSFLDKIKKDWGASAVSFVWASPPCAKYSHANTKTCYFEKQPELNEADAVVRRTLDIINALQCHAAKMHVPFKYIIENPGGTSLLCADLQSGGNRDVIKGLSFFDVSYCHYGHPAQKHTRLWSPSLQGEVIERLKPRVCSSDSASGVCSCKRDSGKHEKTAAGGTSSQPGLAPGAERHKVPEQLVDEIMAALFPRQLSLEQEVARLRKRFSAEALKAEVLKALEAHDGAAGQELARHSSGIIDESHGDGGGSDGCDASGGDGGKQASAAATRREDDVLEVI